MKELIASASNSTYIGFVIAQGEGVRQRLARLAAASGANRPMTFHVGVKVPDARTVEFDKPRLYKYR